MGFTIAISKNRVPFWKNVWLLAFIVVFVVVWANSLVGTTDISNWLLENILVFAFLLFLIGSSKDTSLVTLAIYSFVYTYACMSMALNTLMLITHLDFGFRMFLIHLEIIMTV